MAKALKVIAGAALIAGTLDMVANFILWGVWKHVPPIRICQSIAAGLLGKASFDGGYMAALTGALCQYTITFFMAGVLYLLLRYFPRLRRLWVLTAIGYGLALYVVMNYVVVPLSAADVPFPWPVSWNFILYFNLFCHIALIALVCIVIFRRAGIIDTPNERQAG